MSTTTPINGLPTPDDQSPNDPPIHFAALNAQLDTRLIPRFANAAARNAAITSPVDGMYAHMLDDDRLWLYDGGAGAWTWAKGPQGELVRASFTDTNTTTPLSGTPATLAAFNVSIPALLANRRVEATFTGSIQADAANTAYGFVLAFAGFQRRGLVHIPIANVTQFFNITLSFVSPNTTVGATGSVLGGRFWGPGNCFLAANGLEGPTTYVVRDMGGI